MPFADIGDFEIALGDTLASLKLIEEQAARCRHLIALGGDHAITLPLLRALAKKQGAGRARSISMPMSIPGPTPSARNTAMARSSTMPSRRASSIPTA